MGFCAYLYDDHEALESTETLLPLNPSLPPPPPEPNPMLSEFDVSEDLRPVSLAAMGRLRRRLDLNQIRLRISAAGRANRLTFRDET